MTVPDGSWPTYFPWVISLIQNDEKSEFREVCFVFFEYHFNF